MSGPSAILLGDGNRLHLQHGPIDLIIGADPVSNGGRRVAFAAAADRFKTVLSELAEELCLLKHPLAIDDAIPLGSVARRMDTAARPFAMQAFVTRMAAVAGAVAGEILAAMLAATPLTRAYVNNGGDIALHLSKDAQFITAMAGLNGSDLGRIRIDAASDIRGIATSGQGGRSLSFGIADSVTVLARNAAIADVAATLIANAIDLPTHPEILRKPASELAPDSDLGTRLVVIHVGQLSADDVETALDNGAKTARTYLADDYILGAALTLRGRQRIIGATVANSSFQTKMVQHA